MELRQQVLTIRSKYLKGEITLEQAKKLVEPILREMNERGLVIAKEHGKKFKKLTFGYIWR